MAARSPLSFLRRRKAPVLLLLVAVLCLALVSTSVQAANVVDFASAIQTALRSIAPGFVTYYSALVGAPAIKAQFCTSSIVNMAPGLALTMESINAPYSVLATSSGLVVYKDSFVFGPTISLIGTSYRIADGTPVTTVHTGNSLLIPYSTNSIVMVTGTISNGTTTNILPMARFMMVESYRCTSTYANVSSFSTALSSLFTAFANAAVTS